MHTVRSGIQAEFEKVRQILKSRKADSDMLSGYGEHELTAMVLKWCKGFKAKQEKRRIHDVGQWSEEQRRDYHIELTQEEHQTREELLGMGQYEKHEGAEHQLSWCRYRITSGVEQCVCQHQHSVGANCKRG